MLDHPAPMPISAILAGRPSRSGLRYRASESTRREPVLELRPVHAGLAFEEIDAIRPVGHPGAGPVRLDQLIERGYRTVKILAIGAPAERLTGSIRTSAYSGRKR